MKITIEVTQEELDGMDLMDFDVSDFKEYVIELLGRGGRHADIELPGYNVYVEVVAEKVF